MRLCNLVSGGKSVSQEQSDKLFLRALRGEPNEPPPVWLMRQAGRYLPEYRAVREAVGGFLDLCYSPQRAAEVTLQPITRFGFDAAILFADILLIADALGQDVAFREGEGPVLEAIHDEAGLAALNPRSIDDTLAPVYETVSRLHEALPKEVALIGFAGSPWTVASYMVEGGTSRDFGYLKAWAFGDPDGFGHLIDILVEATTHYLVQQVRAGAEALQLFDTWAGVLPAGLFGRWSIEPTRRIVEAIRAACPGIPILGFPRGAGVAIEAYAQQTGVDGVSLDTSVPLDWAANRLQPKVAVQGNLDPQMVVVGGAAMEAAIDEIIDRLSGGPFVFNLGHGLTPQTPPEHVAQLVRAVRRARKG
jgi:uroporphyrinogen decarboxylase